MVRRLLQLAVVLLLFANVTFSQSTASRQTGVPKSAANRVALDLGIVTVWLGEPEDDARGTLKAAGFSEVNDGIPGELRMFVGPNGKSYDVAFVGRRVTFASRRWFFAGEKESAREMSIALIDALISVSEATKQCIVDHAPLPPQPGIRTDRMFVVCGQRSLLVGNGNEWGGWIDERIGELRPLE